MTARRRREMTAGLVQLAPRFGRVAENLERARSLLAGVRADLLVLPELFATGYLFRSRAEVARLAEPPRSGPTARFLAELARERSCTVVAGFAERAPDGCYNSALLVGPSGVAAVYRKVHLFDEEKRWFLPGQRPFRVHDTPAGRLGLLVCFDWLFPEAMRTLALRGAQVICHAANLVLPFCQDAMVTRSLENRVFILTANRCGADERSGRRLAFTGGSQAMAPGGRLLGRLGPDEEGVLTVSFDPGDADDKRLNRRNDLFADRVPALYR